jgi:hypothetical protein
MVRIAESPLGRRVAALGVEVGKGAAIALYPCELGQRREREGWILTAYINADFRVLAEILAELDADMRERRAAAIWAAWPAQHALERARSCCRRFQRPGRGWAR